MRLLFCSTYPHLPDVIGGLQTTTDDLCAMLVDRGIEPIVLCGLPDDAAKNAPTKPDRSLGYRVIRVVDPLAALPLVAASIEPDAIIVQSSVGLVPVILAAKAGGWPIAVYLHNVEEHRIGGILAPDPSILYIANSRFTAQRMAALYGISAMVLPPVIMAHRYATDATGDRVLFVNPSPLKGLEIVLGLAASCPKIPFTIVESWTVHPAWRERIQHRTRTLRNVELLAPTKDMAGLLARSRLLLMPSVWEEAFGRTAIEAQLAGLPVLASRRGALPETIGEGGFVIDAHAPLDQWKQALEAIYHDRAAWTVLSQRAQANAQATVMRTMVALNDVLMRLGTLGVGQ